MPTCGESAVCSVCGGEISATAAHTPKLVHAKEATADEKGYTGDIVCEVCGYEIEKGREIPIKSVSAGSNQDEPDSPGTGSGSSSALWLAWGIASAFGLLGTAALRRKEKDGR